jgi:hypothetical protein
VVWAGALGCWWVQLAGCRCWRQTVSSAGAVRGLGPLHTQVLTNVVASISSRHSSKVPRRTTPRVHSISYWCFLKLAWQPFTTFPLLKTKHRMRRGDHLSAWIEGGIEDHQNYSLPDRHHPEGRERSQAAGGNLDCSDDFPGPHICKLLILYTYMWRIWYILIIPWYNCLEN